MATWYGEFLHNDAPIHTACIIGNWFNESGIPLSDWAVLTRSEPC